MSFYLRKSLKVGPIRFNLSKSGIGVSAGIKGLRIGAGPRGNYIHAGRGGIYYRKTLSAHAARPVVSKLQLQDDAADKRANASLDDDLIQTTDASATELVAELNRKRQRLAIWPACVVASIGVVFFLVSRRIDNITLGLATVLLLAFCLMVGVWDRRRRTAFLFFNLEEPLLAAFQSMFEKFEQLQEAHRISHIDATEFYSDRKYHAGVLQGLKRSSIRPRFEPPPFVKTNVAVPALPAGPRTLYFFPDRVLVYGRREVNAVAYSDLQVTIDQVRFVESEGVVGDSDVVGETWQYVNKKGGPDLRFRNNPRFPIVLYDELQLRSSSGLNEVYQISKPGISAEIADAFRGVRNQSHVKNPESGPENSPRDLDQALQQSTPTGSNDEDEELVEKCLEIIRQEKRASTSLLQRRLRLGYTRAARIVDILEQRGILGPGEGAKPREILVDLDAAV
jgi:hypothetical protein